MHRRELLRRISSAATAMTAASYQRVMGANDMVQLGLLGAGERGRYVMSQFQATNRVNVAAVCDVYSENIDKARQRATNAKNFADHRKALETKELDAVLIATPDHWHSTIALDAMRAGKDVYIEKPLTLKIEEGPELVKAARVNERVVQVGMQQRSGRHYLEAKQKYLDSGALGKISLVRTWWHGNGYHLRKAPATLAQRPSNLDWARFLGPVKWREWDPQQYWNWRAYLDFGGGQVTDLFTHWIDVVHMFMGPDIPLSAVASGGVYTYKDGRTAPDTINVLLEYNNEKTGEYTVTFEATLAPGIRGEAVEFCGTKGKLYIDRSRYEFREAGRNATPVEVKATGPDMTLDHVSNFLDCVKSRQRPNADVLIGHRSAQASHLGNIAYIQKRRLNFDTQREEIMPF